MLGLPWIPPCTGTKVCLAAYPPEHDKATYPKPIHLAWDKFSGSMHTVY